MKIAHVIVNLGKGGGQRSTIDLIRATEDTFDNHLILLENKRNYDIPDIKTYSLTEDKKIYKKFDLLGDYLLSKKLQKLLNELQVDLVISHMEVTAKVVRFISLPKIFYMRVDITQELETLKEKSSFRYKKRKRLYKKLFDNQNLITISKDTETNICKVINPKVIETIYNPFDKEKIRQLALEKVDIPKTDYIIQIGSGIRKKRQDILLEAFSKIEDKKIKLLLLGTAENKDILNLIKKFNIEKERIIFKSFAQNPYPYIKNAKLLVLSSDREGLPRVIVESLILKTPVVSTDCDTGPRELLINELSKYLSKVNDAEELSININKVLISYPEIHEDYTKCFDKVEIKKKFINYVEKNKNEI